MKRLSFSLVVFLACVTLAWGQGQLINGHRTMTGGLNTGTTTGSANAYVLTLNPPLPGYVLYQCFTFLANHASTGAATLNVNGRGVRAIKKWSSTGLVDVGATGGFPDIATGQYVQVCYDGTVMQVQSGSGGTAGAGGGTVTSVETSSIAGQLTLFAGTTGAVLQAYEGGAGLLKTDASGVPSPAVAGTDYVTPAGTVAAATALAANPADCAPNTYATTIAASGNLTCGQVNLAAGVSGTLPTANLPTTLASVGVSNLWGDGIKQTFNPNGTTAGLNVGSHTSAPAAVANGDLWYDSSGGALMARINGVSVALGAGGGGALTVTEVDGTPSGTFTTLKFSNGSVADNGDGSATINTGAGGGGGDFSSNTALSVDSEVVVFSGAGGKTGKRATGTGLAKLTAGVLSIATGGSDYVTPAGNVATATGLATNGGNCAPGEAALGVDAFGVAEGCFSVSSGLTFTTGLAESGGTVTVALQESGSLFNGTATALTCGTDQGGKWQVGPAQELQYCDYASTPVLQSGVLTKSGLTWGDTTGCATDENLGKLTIIGGVIQCLPDVADAATTAWNDGGATSLTCGGGAQGQHQVMDTGRLQYCGGETAAVLQHGLLLPSPYTWNLSPCVGDGTTCKVTVNASNQLVVSTDQLGEGGGGPGTITRVGNIVAGDAGTTGFPLTNLWWAESAQPAPPASLQGELWLDSTSKNFSVITSDGVVKRLVQSVNAVPNQFLTAIAPDGAASQAQPSSANLTDGNTLVKLTETQILTNKQVVPRAVPLAASSGDVTPNADLYEIFERHDIGGTLNILTPAVSGLNPRSQHPLTFSLCAAATQSVTWSAAYATRYGVPLPGTIPAGTCIGVRYQWNTLSGKWETWGATPDVLTNVPAGGTGVATLTGVAIGNGTAPFTAATSSTVGQTFRVTGVNTYGWGALDLADTDAVTGILPNANTSATSANTPSAIVARDGSGNFAAGTITAALSGNATTATALQADLPYANLTPATASAKLLGRGDGGAGDWQEVTLGTNLAMSGTTLNATGGGGGGTGTIHLGVGGYMIPPVGTNPAVLDASGTWLELKFDNATRECAWWQGRMNADYASGLTLKAPYKTAATSNSFHLDVRLKVSTPGGGTSMDALAFATNNDCNDATVPGTAGAPDEISCLLTNTGGIAAGLTFQIELCRDVANDGAAAKVSLVTPSLEYAK